MLALVILICCVVNYLVTCCQTLNELGVCGTLFLPRCILQISLRLSRQIDGCRLLYHWHSLFLDMFSSLRARSLSWHTFWLSVRRSYVVNCCPGTWNNHFVARTFGTKGHAGRMLSKKRKKIVCWMENTSYANGILLKDLLIFVEPASPERSVLVLTRPPSKPGNNILTSEGQSVEVFYDD